MSLPHLVACWTHVLGLPCACNWRALFRVSSSSGRIRTLGPGTRPEGSRVRAAFAIIRTAAKNGGLFELRLFESDTPQSATGSEGALRTTTQGALIPLAG